MKPTPSILILAAISARALAQSLAPAPSFDVASVKPSPDSGADLININLGHADHGVVTLTNTTLSECIQFAYALTSEDQIDGPDWIRDRHLRVDITAKTSPDTPSDRVHLMMQTLLTERFRLELHRQLKPVRHFDLSIARRGFKARPSPEGAPAQPGIHFRGRIVDDHLSMHTLVVLLSRQLRQPVIDLTGLAGFYDIHLEWAPGEQPPPEASDSAPLPDIFHAVDVQLGLALEPRKTPIEVLVIDHADKVPIAN
jgi:uncharacterized protein (TIGR03435 family)